MSESLLQLYLKNTHDKLENEKEEKESEYDKEIIDMSDYDKQILDMIQLEPSSTSIEEKNTHIIQNSISLFPPNHPRNHYRILKRGNRLKSMRREKKNDKKR